MVSTLAILATLSGQCLAMRVAVENEGELSIEHEDDPVEPVQTRDVLPAGEGDEVDWHFMTEDLTWAGRQQQTTYDVVQGHTCQDVGHYDDSYYASSLCYWHPEKPHGPPPGSQPWGIGWKGGQHPSREPSAWCGGARASGVCARCSMCHDNARDRDAVVDAFHHRVENIPLPEDCMKENAIEAECTSQFEVEHADLLQENVQCHEVHTRFEQAEAALREANAAVTHAETSIAQTREDITRSRADQPRRQTRLDDAQAGVGPTREQARRLCLGIAAPLGTALLPRHLQGMEIASLLSSPAEWTQLQVREMRPECTREQCTRVTTTTTTTTPRHRSGPGANPRTDPFWDSRIVRAGSRAYEEAFVASGMNREVASAARRAAEAQETQAREQAGREFDERHRQFPDPEWEQQQDAAHLHCQEVAQATYDACSACRSHLDTLRSAYDEVTAAESHIQDGLRHIRTLEQRLPTFQQALAQANAIAAFRLQRQETAANEWLPQEEHCGEVVAEAAGARSRFMTVCPQRYYDRSCEKACIEIQRQGDHGCGVIEGSEDGDATGKGGVEVTCEPPAPSWIMSPYSGGNPRPNRTEICHRINAEQAVRRTTPVIMSGWMQKSGYHIWSFGSHRRFFVLESGNGVRSAVLRKWNGPPTGDGVEHTNKGIIMWDAEEVSVGETSDSQACFEIKHYFRGRRTSWLSSGTTHTMCLTREEYPDSNLAELRDEWVAKLQPTLVWQPRLE